MLASAFILDQRIADLRSSDQEQRIARWRRDAAGLAMAASARVDIGRRWVNDIAQTGQPARAAAR